MPQLSSDPRFTRGEQLANALTHGLGTLLAVAGLVLLVVFSSLQGGPRHIMSFSIFGVTLVLLYLASTLNHSLQDESARHGFEILDHAAIFLLIAGTYTPFTLVVMKGALGWTFFGVQWLLALSGIILKAVLGHRFLRQVQLLSTLFYIVMGWMFLGGIHLVVRNLPSGGIAWLFIGGGCYTLGTVFFSLKKIPYSHLVWHLLVLAGSFSHFWAVLRYVLQVS